MFPPNWPQPQQTIMMADQHTTELLPQQEHSMQTQPTNQTKPKALCNPRTPKYN
jgi:hypothetical protein